MPPSIFPIPPSQRRGRPIKCNTDKINCHFFAFGSATNENVKQTTKENGKVKNKRKGKIVGAPLGWGRGVDSGCLVGRGACQRLHCKLAIADATAAVVVAPPLSSAEVTANLWRKWLWAGSSTANWITPPKEKKKKNGGESARGRWLEEPPWKSDPQSMQWLCKLGCKSPGYPSQMSEPVGGNGTSWPEEYPQ